MEGNHFILSRVTLSNNYAGDGEFDIPPADQVIIEGNLANLSQAMHSKNHVGDREFAIPGSRLGRVMMKGNATCKRLHAIDNFIIISKPSAAFLLACFMHDTHRLRELMNGKVSKDTGRNLRTHFSLVWAIRLWSRQCSYCAPCL